MEAVADPYLHKFSQRGTVANLSLKITFGGLYVIIIIYQSKHFTVENLKLQ